MIDISFSAWLFLSLALGLLLIPLGPAVRQWQTPRNAPPMQFDPPGPQWDADATDAMARTRENFANLIAMSEKDGVIRGAHTDGTAFMVLGSKEHLAAHLPPSARRMRMQVISARHLDIPGELVCDRLVFAAARLVVAHHAILKHALAGREAVIGSAARIRRWLRAESRIDAAEGAMLIGCASAGQEIVLSRRCRFEKMLAPVIRFGRAESPRASVQPERLMPMQVPANTYTPGDGRWISEGDLSVPPGHSVNARLVVGGSLLVGTGARLAGDVHVMGDLIVHHDATLSGAIICDGDMRIGECCRIQGPVRVSGQLSSGSQSIFGSPAQASTVIAREMRLQEGCVAHGAIWAQRRGEVIPETGARQS